MTPKPETRRYRILIVDDHDISTRHALAALKSSTSDIRAASSAIEAISLVERWLPDVVCIDLHLQDAEGTELIRQIRRSRPGEGQAPKIIVISGDDSGISPQEMALLDVDCLLVKPVSGRRLRQLIGVDDRQGNGELNDEHSAGELHGLFLSELNKRIPRLDRRFARLELDKVARILHQLIASAAIARESCFESELRALSATCRNGGSNHELATRYHTVLESARRLLSRR